MSREAVYAEIWPLAEFTLPFRGVNENDWRRDDDDERTGTAEGAAGNASGSSEGKWTGTGL